MKAKRTEYLCRQPKRKGTRSFTYTAYDMREVYQHYECNDEYPYGIDLSNLILPAIDAVDYGWFQGLADIYKSYAPEHSRNNHIN